MVLSFLKDHYTNLLSLSLLTTEQKHAGFRPGEWTSRSIKVSADIRVFRGPRLTGYPIQDCAQQGDYIQCGVHVAAFMEAAAKGEAVSGPSGIRLEPQDAQAFRGRMLVLMTRSTGLELRSSQSQSSTAAGPTSALTLSSSANKLATSDPPTSVGRPDPSSSPASSPRETETPHSPDGTVAAPSLRRKATEHSDPRPPKKAAHDMDSGDIFRSPQSPSSRASPFSTRGRKRGLLTIIDSDDEASPALQKRARRR